MHHSQRVICVCCWLPLQCALALAVGPSLPDQSLQLLLTGPCAGGYCRLRGGRARCCCGSPARRSVLVLRQRAGERVGTGVASIARPCLPVRAAGGRSSALYVCALASWTQPLPEPAAPPPGAGLPTAASQVGAEGCSAAVPLARLTFQKRSHFGTLCLAPGTSAPAGRCLRYLNAHSSSNGSSYHYWVQHDPSPQSHSPTRAARALLEQRPHTGRRRARRDTVASAGQGDEALSGRTQCEAPHIDP